MSSGEPFRVVVEEGKVHEFARATKSSLADHLRSPDPVSPVTFLTSAALWMKPENSAWHGVTRNFANILHGEQYFDFAGPPPVAGTELNAVQYFGKVFDKAGRRGGRMTFTEIITKFWLDSPDDPIATSTAVSIETEPLSESAPAAPPSAPAAAASTPDVGRALPPLVDQPLTVTDFVKYQGASGDFNPIHHDSVFAQASGFPGPFAVGMLPAGIAAAYVTDRYGAESVRRYKVRWRNQAWPGDVLTYQGYVLDDADFDLRLTVTRPNGQLHLEAWAKLWGR